MPVLNFEVGDIPFDVHGRIKARLATTLRDNGRPDLAAAPFEEDAILAAYLDQTMKVGILKFGGLVGDYAPWEDEVFWHTDREIRRLFGFVPDPLSPPPLDFP